MSIRKKSDEPKSCLSPENEPPDMILLGAGTYEHKCSSCHKKTIFRVNGVYL